MSTLKLFRAVDDLFEEGGDASSNDAPAILSFVVEGRKLRNQMQFALTRRARAMHRNLTCPNCERARVIPLFDSLVSSDREQSWNERELGLVCEGCGADWVA